MRSYSTEKVDFTQRVLVDILGTARAPDAHAMMLLDMSAVHQFREAYREQHGVSLSDLHLIIKAVALTLAANSALNSAIHNYRKIVPDTVDIGVSVATGRSVAPVIVLKDTPNLSLREIHDQLKAGAERAKESERREAEQGPPRWHQYARFAPNWMRRGVIRAMSNSFSIKRSKVGTVQITSMDLSDVEFYLPTHLGTTTLISVGGTRLRPLVVNGQVEARPTAYVAFSVDQRVVSAVRSIRVFHRFKTLMNNPHLLDKQESVTTSTD